MAAAKQGQEKRQQFVDICSRDLGGQQDGGWGEAVEQEAAAARALLPLAYCIVLFLEATAVNTAARHLLLGG